MKPTAFSDSTPTVMHIIIILPLKSVASINLKTYFYIKYLQKYIHLINFILKGVKNRVTIKISCGVIHLIVIYTSLSGFLFLFFSFLNWVFNYPKVSKLFDIISSNYYNWIKKIDIFSFKSHIDSFPKIKWIKYSWEHYDISITKGQTWR